MALIPRAHLIERGRNLGLRSGSLDAMQAGRVPGP